MVGKISRAHFFVSEIVRWILRIDHDVSVVIGRARIVAPNVGFGDLMIRIIPARRQFGVVSKNFSDRENSGWGAPVPLFLMQTWLVLAGETAAPRQPTLPEQHRN